MDLKAMRAKRAKAIENMRAILAAVGDDNRTELTAEEQSKYDALKAEVDSADKTIAMLEEQDALEASLSQVTPAAAAGQGSGISPGTPAPRAGGEPAKKDFETFGQFLATVRVNPGDQRLASLFKEDAGANAEDLGGLDSNGQPVAEQSMGTGAAGGFMVPEQFRSEIMRVDPQASIVRPRATVIPAGSPPDSAITIPALDQTGDAPANMFGGVEVNWIAEGETKPETDTEFKGIKLEPQEVAGHVVITDKLLRNWQASGPFVSDLLRGAVTQSEDLAFLIGNGIGKPKGALLSSAAIAINRATTDTVTYADLVNMEAKILMRGGAPVWIACQAVLPKLRNLTDLQGLPIFAGPRDGLPATLMGHPLIFNNRAPGLGNKADISIADFSAYLIKDGSGPFVAMSEHVHFKQNKTVIKIFWNVDGQPWLEAPFKEENGYEVSPFVVLDVPA